MGGSVKPDEFIPGLDEPAEDEFMERMTAYGFAEEDVERVFAETAAYAEKERAH